MPQETKTGIWIVGRASRLPRGQPRIGAPRQGLEADCGTVRPGIAPLQPQQRTELPIYAGAVPGKCVSLATWQGFASDVA